MDFGDVTLVKGFAPSSPRTFFGKSRLACFYNCRLSVTLRLGFLTESKSEDNKKATDFTAAHIRARGGIGRHDGFRFHCASVQVQVLSGAPLRNDLWMSGSRAGRARLDSKGLSSFKPVTALLGHGFVFIRHEAPPCGAAMMSGIFRFGFLVRRCPICVILHIYHHAVAQYHIEKYGKHTADCT